MIKKYILISIAAILVTVVILIVSRIGKYQAGTAPGAATSTAESRSGSATTTPGKPAPIHSGVLTYTEAIKIYATRRIQFDSNCAMSPNGSVFKNPATLMFDNRSDAKRTFYLDRQAHSIPAYDYVILKVAAPILPHTVIVDCGTGRNTGTIILN